jgi:hypothetical protein
MTDWSAILAYAFQMTDRECGDAGDSGDKRPKALRQVENRPHALGTTCNRPVVTVVTPHNDEAVTTVTTATSGGGDEARKAFPSAAQQDRHSVTTVTTVTTVARGIHSRGGGVIDRLRSTPPPESFGAETWRQLLVDADAFFHCWAQRAELLAWSDKELVGVHPGAPAARFDAMGLLLLIRGGEVIELQDQCARIRSQGGSLLVYRKHGYVGAVPLWEVGSA